MFLAILLLICLFTRYVYYSYVIMYIIQYYSFYIAKFLHKRFIFTGANNETIKVGGCSYADLQQRFS